MSDRVVNIRLGEPFDVYIGRAGRGFDGRFGNPYPVGQTCSRCGERHARGGDTLGCFRACLVDRAQRDPGWRNELLALRGKTLGCFCAPPGGLTAEDELRCHGQIILRWLDEQERAAKARLAKS